MRINNREINLNFKDIKYWAERNGENIFYITVSLIAILSLSNQMYFQPKSTYKTLLKEKKDLICEYEHEDLLINKDDYKLVDDFSIYDIKNKRKIELYECAVVQ